MKPKLKFGDIIGDLQITAYLGDSHNHPILGTYFSKNHHWYQCRCLECDVHVTRYQQQLLDKRYPSVCRKLPEGKLHT